MSGCSASVITKDTGTGSSQINVAFVDVPEEFKELNENMIQNFFIMVRMKNIATDKNYVILLNEDNNYSVNIKVPPGKYKVQGVSSNMTRYTGAVLLSNRSSLEVSQNESSEIGVYISNREEFISVQNNLTECVGIAKAGMFSRKIMVSGQIYDMEDILKVINSNGGVVNPYSTSKVTFEETGITVTVMNESSTSLSFSSCRVIGVEISEVNSIFPGGVSIGMDSSEVSGPEGIYGVPSKFSGCAIFDEYLWETQGIYIDSQSGDKITVTYSPYGGYVCKLKYEFECFE